MARRSQHSFLKRQKEMKRKDKALEKMAQRHGKGGPVKDAGDNEQQAPDQAPDEASDQALDRTDDKEVGS